MNRFLWRKYVAESWWLWLACAAGLGGFSWLRVWLVSELEMQAFQTIIMQVWDDFQKFSSVPLSELFTYVGRIARTFTEPVVIVCGLGWAVTRGSDCVSGELGRGTLEMMLAQPVGRRSLLWQHCLATTVGSALLAAVVWVGIESGVQQFDFSQTVRPSLLQVPFTDLDVPNPWAEPRKVETPLRTRVPLGTMTPGCVALFCLMFFTGGAATMLSALDRYRWRTIGAMIGFLVLQSTLQYFAVASPSWSWLGWLTVFSVYEPERFISQVAGDPIEAWQWWRFDANGVLQAGPLGACLLLLGLGLLCYAVAARVFARRDLPAPA